jgi:hypothetical protein
MGRTVPPRHGLFHVSVVVWCLGSSLNSGSGVPPFAKGRSGGIFRPAGNQIPLYSPFFKGGIFSTSFSPRCPGIIAL